MHIDTLDHLVLTVRDLEATIAFYSRVLGMEAVTFGAGRRALANFGFAKIRGIRVLKTLAFPGGTSRPETLGSPGGLVS